MDNEREPAPAGVFDKPVEKEAIQQANEWHKEKEDFKDVFQVSEQERNKLSSKRRPPPISDLLAEKTSKALGDVNDVQKEMDDIDKISEEDLNLAEQLIFKGYAQFDASMSNLPKFKFTICSTSAEEVGLIDEIIYDIVKVAKERPDGTVDLPQSHISTMRNALYVALSYRGLNQKELMDGEPACYLNHIKNASIKVNDLYNEGKLEEANKLKESLKQCLIKRAGAVKRLPTPTIDFLSGKKYEFDTKMLRIMSQNEILPKS